jgi:hypothetical protein
MYKPKGHMKVYKIAVILMISVNLWISCSPERKQPSGEKATPSRSINQQSFEGIYRATKAIDGAIAVGVSYIKFQELLQSLATEILIANDKVKSQQERDLLGMYSEVLSMYRDSAILLKYAIKHSGETDYYGRTFVVSELSPIVVKYNLVTSRGVGVGREDSTTVISINDSIKVVWGTAHDQLETANALFLGK